MGGLLEIRDGVIDDTLSTLDDLAAQLIFETNKLHSTGRNAAGQTEAAASLRLSIDNR